MKNSPSFDDIFAVMSAVSVGDLEARVAIPDQPILDDTATKFALALNIVLDDLSVRANELAQRIRRKCRDRGCELRHRFSVTRKKFRQRLAVRQIEPAASRHQKLAARGRHRVVDCDMRANLREHFSRHQAGRTGADDGDLGLGRA